MVYPVHGFKLFEFKFFRIKSHEIFFFRKTKNMTFSTANGIDIKFQSVENLEELYFINFIFMFSLKRKHNKKNVKTIMEKQ